MDIEAIKKHAPPVLWLLDREIPPERSSFEVAQYEMLPSALAGASETAEPARLVGAVLKYVEVGRKGPLRKYRRFDGPGARA